MPASRTARCARLIILAVCSPMIVSCLAGLGSDGPAENPTEDAKTNLPDYLEELERGPTQRASLCSRSNNDRMARWYCNGASPPAIRGIVDLLNGLSLSARTEAEGIRFAMTAQSTSLVSRSTSALNPRAIVFSGDTDPDYIALGFVRGDAFVEIAAFDPEAARLNFYLVRFTPACEPTCGNAQLFLPEFERDWQSIDVYDDEDLKNTVFDCRHCHQPGGDGTTRILRMQEFQRPWTHWFHPRRNSNVLLADFVAAHAGENYAGIPADLTDLGEGDFLEAFMRAHGFNGQPNEYFGDLINNDDPSVNTPNAEWLRLYQAAISGTAISPPHFAIDPFDRSKVTQAIASYQAVAAGDASPSQMQNPADVFLESNRAFLGFTAAPDLTAEQIVNHRCRTCHDGRFRGITRDRFRVADFPNNLSAKAKAEIMKRLDLPAAHRLRMPPAKFSDLTAEQRELIKAKLRP